MANQMQVAINSLANFQDINIVWAQNEAIDVLEQSPTHWLDFFEVQLLFANRHHMNVTPLEELPIERTGIFLILQPNNGLRDGNIWDRLPSPFPNQNRGRRVNTDVLRGPAGLVVNTSFAQRVATGYQRTSYRIPGDVHCFVHYRQVL